MSVTMYLKIHILSKRWTFSPEGGEGVGSARTLELKRGVIRWWTNIRLWPIFRRTGIDRLTCVGNDPHHSTESGGDFLLGVRTVSSIRKKFTGISPLSGGREGTCGAGTQAASQRVAD